MLLPAVWIWELLIALSRTIHRSSLRITSTGSVVLPVLAGRELPFLFSRQERYLIFGFINSKSPSLIVVIKVQSFEHLVQMAEKKTVTPLTVETEELEAYEDKFKAALELLKTSVDEEKQGQLEKSDRVRRKSKHPGAPSSKRFKGGAKPVRGKKRVGLKLNKRKMGLKQPRNKK